MLANAVMYNREDAEIFEWICEMKAFADEKIALFIRSEQVALRRNSVVE